MANESKAATEYLIRHMILPPKLPQMEDSKPENDKALLQTTVAALRQLQSYLSTAEPLLAEAFDSPISAITQLLLSRNKEGTLSEDQLVKSLRNLATTGTPAAVPLHVKAQNACILIKRFDENIVFETFELSPQDEQVMATKGRLIRTFPTQACRIHRERMLEQGLIEALAHHIVKLSNNEVPEFCFGKKGANYGAPATSTHPALVTDYLISVLAAIGTPATISNITKNTREEIIYSSSGSPWRRSPLWLLVRVVLQLEFARSINPLTLATSIYKVAIATLLAKLLGQADHDQLDPVLLYLTSVKLARRLRKLKFLSEELYQLCANPIQDIMVTVQRKLEGAWADTMKHAESDIDMSILSSLRPESDTLMSMQQLDRFLGRIEFRKPQQETSDFAPTSECAPFDHVELQFVIDDAGEHRFFQLSTVELWVNDHLSTWLNTHKYEQKTCHKLFRLMMDYHRAADCLYSEADAPSSLSIMYITIAELWIACDTSACAMYPLLAEYSLEVNFSLLQSLSLPLKNHMERLLAIERYAQSRQERADVGLPSVLREFGHAQSFAVRFYDTSESLQDLRMQIERDAMNEEQQKIDELREKLKKHKALIADSDRLTCTNHEIVYKVRGRKRKAEDDSSKCQKCQLRAEAERICIRIHEWPLHSDESHAKSTIFEVRIPEPYSNWRDATVYLLKDVFRFAVNKDSTSKESSYTVDRYEGLKSFRKGPDHQRLRIYSRKQPRLGASKYIKDGVTFLTDADVCVANDLPYQYYDISDKYTMEELEMTQRVQQKCTYQAPDRSLQLQRFMNPTVTPNYATPNEAMASVSHCPHHLSLDEYKAISLLALGNSIHYLNILAQLRAPVIDFTKVEAHCLVHQIVHVAGPPIGNSDSALTIARANNSILHDRPFCQALLQEIHTTLQNTQGNWETWRVLGTCVLLTLRIVALTETPDIVSLGLHYLTSARAVARGWVDALNERLLTTTNSEHRAELACRKTEVALLCISTLDVDNSHIDSFLSSTDAVSDLLKMSIIIRENKDAVSSDHVPLYRAMLQNWRNILFRFSPKLRDGLVSRRFEADINTAVAAAWTGFRPCGGWQVLAEPKHHWVHMRSGVLDIHFNLLSADLLVNGLPLARLPEEYTEHETYIALFGELPIEVMPTTERGMVFSAKHDHAGYMLHFGMDKVRNCMLVVAVRSGETFDLVPRTVFQDILPDAFVEDYYHWFNHETKKVEFRPINKPWVSTGDLWYLEQIGHSWILENATSRLIYPSSKTGAILSRMLEPLEHWKNIHISLNTSSSIVSIALVKKLLDFYIPPGDYAIHSCQYTGKIIDPDQSFGTLVGLTSKLVLREERKPEGRMILIPEGTIKYAKTLDHVSVSIEPNTTIKIHDYHFDVDLARLEDNGTLQSKLLLCYLHALTSHFFPDSATGLTGTEAALTILRSAAVSSFGMLSLQNMKLLSLIANLTPMRTYRPASIKSMQQLQWDDKLPFLSQHGSFFVEVDRLYQQTRNYSLLYDKNVRTAVPKLKSVQPELLLRDDIRTSLFRTDGFGAENYTRRFDMKYKGRDVSVDSNRSQRSVDITTMLLRDHVALAYKVENLQLSLHSKHLKDSRVQGPNPIEPASLEFTPDWLAQPARYLPRLWCSLHTSLSTSPYNLNRFTVILFLSTLAFAKGADMEIVQSLGAFYREPALRLVTPPQFPEFDLSLGHDPKLHEIESIVRSMVRLFQGSQEFNLPRRSNETWNEWYDRKATQFRLDQDQAVNAFASSIHNRWPSEKPAKPSLQNADKYINTNSVMDALNVRFKSWYANRLFYIYTQEIANALNRMAVVPVPQVGRQSTYSVEDSVDRKSTGSFGISEIFSLPPPLPSNRIREFTWLFAKRLLMYHSS